MRQVVLILNADDRDNLPSLRDLCGRYVAKPDMTDQTFLLKLGQGGELRFD